MNKEMSNFSVDDITLLELQWQKLNSYDWKNQKSTTEFWINIFEYKNAINENPFRELSTFVMKFLVLPFSNAEVERVFSGMNIIKTKIRNRFSLNTMNSLLYIRCGLKRLNKCCQSFEITKDLLKKFDKDIYTTDNDFLSCSEVEENIEEYDEMFNI